MGVPEADPPPRAPMIVHQPSGTWCRRTPLRPGRHLLGEGGRARDRRAEAGRRRARRGEAPSRAGIARLSQAVNPPMRAGRSTRSRTASARPGSSPHKLTADFELATAERERRVARTSTTPTAACSSSWRTRRPPRPSGGWRCCASLRAHDVFLKRDCEVRLGSRAICPSPGFSQRISRWMRTQNSSTERLSTNTLAPIAGSSRKISRPIRDSGVVATPCVATG